MYLTMLFDFLNYPTHLPFEAVITNTKKHIFMFIRSQVFSLHSCQRLRLILKGFRVTP